MITMKKKIWIPLVVIVVLIAAWLGGSWYTGKRIEAEIDAPLALLNQKLLAQDSPAKGQIKQLSYERGLFSSHARYALTMTLPLPNQQQPDQQIMEFDVTIWHGPFPLEALQHGNLLPMKYWGHGEVLMAYGPLKMMVGAVMNGKPPLVLDGHCSYRDHCAITSDMPPINFDLGAIFHNAKLSFGGVQAGYDIDYRTDTDYNLNVNMQFLPLSISGQNFGSGQVTITGDGLSANEVISWKTDQGQSKATFAYTLTQPMSIIGLSVQDDQDIQNLLKLIKTGSINLSLSRPMVVDFAARVLNGFQGIDLATAKQQVGEKLDGILSAPDTAKFFRTQDDLLVSDWQYADDKLTINGQENPELLTQIKEKFQEAMQLQQQAQKEVSDQEQPASGEENASAASAAPSAPASAASGQ